MMSQPNQTMTTTTKPPTGLLARLEQGPVICAEGYIFELERRGYVQAGSFVPGVVLEYPEAVLELHREFTRAGSDVVLALTYYAHRAKLAAAGWRESAGFSLEALNRQAVRLARQVAAESGALVAGNICNTNIYDPDQAATHAQARAIFAEQVAWAADEGVDYIVGETFYHRDEALLALAVIREAGLPAVITLAIHRDGRLRDGTPPAEACRALREAGAAVVGLNCIRGPASMLPLLPAIAAQVAPPLAALPVAYRTPMEQPTFQSLQDPAGILPAHSSSFPTALDPFTCTRYEMADFAGQALALGFNYLGVCCGGAPHHVRAMAEALGRRPPASQYSPDMSRHFALGNPDFARPANHDFRHNL